jgi:guanylate kinase
MGSTGCGKTTIVRCLEKVDPRFTYIRPYTTRPLRQGETDKVFITDNEMQDLWDRGALIVVNNLYGIKYGTPRLPFEDAFEKKHFPVIDWPIQRIQIMETAFPDKLFRVYIKPPNLTVLEQRLKERIDFQERVKFAKDELEEVEQNKYNELIDMVVTNETDKTSKVAKLIYQKYLDALRVTKSL